MNNMIRAKDLTPGKVFSYEGINYMVMDKESPIAFADLCMKTCIPVVSLKSGRFCQFTGKCVVDPPVVSTGITDE